MAGYIPLSRSFFDTPEWCEKRVYSRAEAWLDMIAMAAFAEHVRWVDDVSYVPVYRGEIIASQRQLAKRWGWSTATVNRYLKRLSEGSNARIEVYVRRIVVLYGETPSETPSETSVSVIKLSKYDTYNVGTANSETPHETPHETPSETQDNKVYNNKGDNNTHTQFDCLKFFTHTHEAHAHTPEQMCEVASAIREQVQRGELPEYKSIDDVAKGMIWLYAEYPELMQRFKRPCTRQDFQTISQMCEVEDVKGIVEALANKLSGDKPLNSFLATFKQWAALDYRIKDKARLGNPRYNKLS